MKAPNKPLAGVGSQIEFHSRLRKAPTLFTITPPYEAGMQYETSLQIGEPDDCHPVHSC